MKRPTPPKKSKEQTRGSLTLEQALEVIQEWPLQTIELKTDNQKLKDQLSQPLSPEKSDDPYWRI